MHASCPSALLPGFSRTADVSKVFAGRAFASRSAQLHDVKPCTSGKQGFTHPAYLLRSKPFLYSAMQNRLFPWKHYFHTCHFYFFPHIHLIFSSQLNWKRVVHSQHCMLGTCCLISTALETEWVCICWGWEGAAHTCQTGMSHNTVCNPADNLYFWFFLVVAKSLPLGCLCWCHGEDVFRINH